MNPLLLALILSILPISELRGGMIYAFINGIDPYVAFLACTFANILIIFPVFFFLDFFHEKFMKISLYRKSFDYYIKRIRKKVDKFEKSFGIYGFFALFAFVAIPLPATGAWTGILVAWLLGLDRKKSIIAIVLGVLTAGIIVLLGLLGIAKII